MKRVTVAVLLAGGLLAACTHSVHTSNVTDFAPLKPGAVTYEISAETEQVVVLYITDNTDFVDEAYAELLAQCPDGEIAAVQSRYSTSHNFLSFTNRLRLTGLCIMPRMRLVGGDRASL